MHFILWIIVSIIAGFIASKIVNKKGDGLILDLILGIIGGFIGGWIISLFGVAVGHGLILHLIAAIVGAVILLLIYHGIKKAL